MMTRIIIISAVAALSLSACVKKADYDASGTFEAEEIIVSAEQTGKILQLQLQEGITVKAGQQIGVIDVTNLQLQKEQREASLAALQQKTVDVGPQVALVRKQLAVQQAQLAQQQRERSRTSNLVKADAATQKQLDDIDAAIDQLRKTIEVTRQQIALYESNTGTQNRTIMSEAAPAEKAVAVVEDQIKRGQIVNPINGTVLTQYAYEGEYAVMGKPLYKIADLGEMTLRAYVTGNQLPGLKLNQQVSVLTDDGSGDYKTYKGSISWISSKAEFTPKTIQTKDERADLVYAVKIRVKNDGYLKIGMYSDVRF
jgi:HlyD family secretion protein